MPKPPTLAGLPGQPPRRRLVETLRQRAAVSAVLAALEVYGLRQRHRRPGPGAYLAEIERQLDQALESKAKAAKRFDALTAWLALEGEP